MNEILTIDITADNKNAIAAIQQTRRSVDDLKDSIKLYQDKAFNETDVVKAKEYNLTIQQLQLSLKQMTNVGKIGFDEMGNATAAAERQTQKLAAAQERQAAAAERQTQKLAAAQERQAAAAERQTQKLAAAQERQAAAAIKAQGNFNNVLLNTITNSDTWLRKIAMISERFVIMAAFQVAFVGIQKAIELIGLKADQATTNLSNLNDVMAKANKDAGTDIVNARLLYEASTDVSLSMKDRVTAAKELQKIYPEYLKNFTAEAITAGKADEAYKKLNASILQNAQARAAVNKVAELESAILDAEFQKQKIRNANSAETKRAQDTRSTDLEGNSTITTAAQLIAGSNVRAKKGLEDQDKIITTAKEQQDFLINFFGKKALEKVTILDDGKTEKGVTALKGVAKVLDDLRKELLAIDAVEPLHGFEKTKIDSVNAYTKAIEGLAKNGLDPAGKEIEKLIAKRDEFFKSSGGTKSVDTTLEKAGKDFAPLANAPQQTGEAVDRNQKFIDNETKRAAQIQKNKNALDEYKNAEKEAGQAANIAGDAFVTLFNAIAHGQNIGQVLIGVFENLAEEIAKAAVKAAVLKIVLSVLSAGTTNIAGAGAEIGKSLLGFASGGTVTGPKSGYPIMVHGTESIVRPDQMNSIIGASAHMGAALGSEGGANGNMQLNAAVSGDQLKLWINRADFSQNLRR